jgi:hypothetical protein
MNTNLSLLLFCALCFALAALASYMELVWELKETYKEPKNDTKPQHPIERPKAA